jgi:hypothetical protein
VAAQHVTPMPLPHDDHEDEDSRPMDRRQRGAIFDPRIDRMVSWALMTAATIALAVGAWFFTDLRHSIDDLKSDVKNLSVAQARTESDRRDIEQLQRELAEMRNLVYELRKK